MSPSRSNAISRPSGETSSDIQVPLVVSITDVTAGSVARRDVPLAWRLVGRFGCGGDVRRLLLGQRLGGAGLREGRRHGRGRSLGRGGAGKRGCDEKNCETAHDGLPPRDDIRGELWRCREPKATRATAVGRNERFVDGIGALRLGRAHDQIRTFPTACRSTRAAPFSMASCSAKGSASASTGSKRPMSRNIRFPKAGSTSPPAAAATASAIR